MSAAENMANEDLAAELERRKAEAAKPAPPSPSVPATLSPEEESRLVALRNMEEQGRKALDEEFPTAWLPWKADSDHPHELPACLVTAIDPHVGPSATFGTYSAVIQVIDTEGRRWSLWANKPDSAMWHALLRLRLQVGEVVGLRFSGARPSKNDPARTVNDVRIVRVDDASEEPAPIDYAALRAERATPEITEQASTAAVVHDDDIPF